MINFIIFLILIVTLYYFQYHRSMFILSICLLFYSCILYNCFVDNKIIFNWLKEYESRTVETIDFITEIDSYNTIFNIFISLVAIIILCYIWYIECSRYIYKKDKVILEKEMYINKKDYLFD